uniref:DNA mismatch repair proteins mutS family domain-containing protein n=1 Tax=Chromera velia CCMP2878 TaxID=1169474 RepID=A0A0K6S9E2_9ALVE|eukprot:Cvel_7123.t1-p1 / transcript=Cvel_7123.t1 / gene=Cvel_7123 / organism=Chromera_velia_CCMP2878 / gene_product=DNA mismatch repair protein MSH1, mitochondrial, putative / transcript_product=DNA mismatch repair protein MSH1, mitochondrial, putative / location=Cvel_scaffold365:60120-68905(+) / protein_length=1497 / sequence_SO=supercontig / SO=protein_coding / is_pseudo=false
MHIAVRATFLRSTRSSPHPPSLFFLSNRFPPLSFSTTAGRGGRLRRLQVAPSAQSAESLSYLHARRRSASGEASDVGNILGDSSSPSSYPFSSSSSSSSKKKPGGRREKKRSGPSPYWDAKLEALTRHSARQLVPLLSDRNALGFEASEGMRKEGTLFAEVLAWKEAHPEKVILTRCGEFYETYGVDAVMLVEHCGLNSMGGKPKAGCRVAGLQQTLDCLTAAGLTAAVYEEFAEGMLGMGRGSFSSFSLERGSGGNGRASRGGGSVRKIKKRGLSQIVSPGAPVYLYGAALRTEDMPFGDELPFVGIVETAGLQIPDAVEILRGHPSADSFFGAVLDRVCERAGADPRTFTTIEADEKRNGTFAYRPLPLYLSTAAQIGLLTSHSVTARGRALGPGPSGIHAPVPDLVRSLLPDNSPAFCSRFLRSWLLSPPPYRIADAAQELCRAMAQAEAPLPLQVPAVASGKIVSLVSSREGNAAFFRELGESLEAAWRLLESPHHAAARAPLLDVLAYVSGMDADGARLVSVGRSVCEEIDRTVVPESLVPSDLCSVRVSEEVGGLHETRRGPLPLEGSLCERWNLTDPKGRILLDLVRAFPSFFERNEEEFRGKVRRNCTPEVQSAYEQVESKALTLLEAVQTDLVEDPRGGADRLTHDVVNNAIYLRKGKPTVRLSYLSPEGEGGGGGDTRVDEQTDESRREQERENKGGGLDAQAKAKLVHACDRNGKELANRLSTRRVQQAIAEYVEACTLASGAVRDALRSLSERIERGPEGLGGEGVEGSLADLQGGGGLPSCVQMALVITLTQTFGFHVQQAVRQGWSLPLLEPLRSFERVERGEEGKGPSGASREGKEGKEERQAPSSSKDETPLASPPPDGFRSLRLNRLLPFWLPDGVPNSVDLDRLLLLTAPNMSGKSTLMRSVTVAALLGNCGLFIPCLRSGSGVDSLGGGSVGESWGGMEGNDTLILIRGSLSEGETEEAFSLSGGSRVPRIDAFFLKAAGFDVPSEGRSAFAQEIDDVRVMLRDCSTRSLVMMDELGRGTSARDGASIAGAVLETLAGVPVKGIFATHLHELLQLPLRDPKGNKLVREDSDACVHPVRMGFERDEEGGEGVGEEGVRWTFRLERGVCTESLAVQTAARFGLPQKVLERTVELGKSFDSDCRGAVLLSAEEEDGLSAASTCGSLSDDSSDPLCSSGSSSHTGAETERSVGRERDGEMLEGEGGLEREWLERTTSSSSSAADVDSVLERADAIVSGLVSDFLAPLLASPSPSPSAASSARGPGTGRPGEGPSPLPVSLSIPPGWAAPPRLEAQPVLYLLALPVPLSRSPPSSDSPTRTGGGRVQGGKIDGVKLYVGETEALGQRLQQHRSKGPAWKGAPALAWALPAWAGGRSATRRLEASAIAKLRASGFRLESDHDGSHQHFSLTAPSPPQHSSDIRTQVPSPANHLERASGLQLAGSPPGIENDETKRVKRSAPPIIPGGSAEKEIEAALKCITIED